MPTKLISIYARVSTARQEEEQTVLNQLDTLREHAKKNNWIIVEEYVDDGWSGDVLARPALDKLRQDAKSKAWNSVLIYDPDRLARRYSYQELVTDELREAGIEVLFMTISAPKNSEDKILYGVRGLFAEYERTKIAERFRLGKLRKVREGHILVSEPLYGYTYIPKNDKVHGYYVENPEESRIIKMIFDWVANQGMTLRKVVRKLQEMGIKPRKSKRGVWNTSTLCTLLRNRAYVGEARWGTSYAVVPENPLKVEKYRKLKKTSRKIKPKEDWIASSIPVPAIIDLEIFERAGKQLDANFALCKRNKKNEYLLAGKIKCLCGKTRTGEGPMQGKHLYYRCSDRVLSFPLPRTCVEKGINARIADQLVWGKITELMSSPDLLYGQIERWFNSLNVKKDNTQVDVSFLNNEVEKLKLQEERYSKAYGAGVFTLEQLKEYSAPVREKIADLKKQIAHAMSETSHEKINKKPNKEEIDKFATKSLETLKNLSFQSKREIVVSVIDKVVGTQKELQVFGYIPITSNNYVEYKTISGNCWTPECWKIYII